MNITLESGKQLLNLLSSIDPYLEKHGHKSLTLKSDRKAIMSMAQKELLPRVNGHGKHIAVNIVRLIEP
jgi:hypothetical protein